MARSTCGAQQRFGFARIVIAVVVEENDFAADFGAEAPGRQNLGDEEPFGEYPAWLLAEADDRGGAHVTGDASGGCRNVWKSRHRKRHEPQPIRLYQR